MNIRLPSSLQSVPSAVQGFPETVRRANPRTRLILSALGAVAALALVWVVAARLTAPQQRTMPPPPVRVARVLTKNVTAFEQTIGTVVANDTVQVTSRVQGQLESAAFTEGQMVHKGDVLFRLDPKPFQAALAQANATTARDLASLKSAQNDAKRYTILAKLGAVAPSQRDQFVAQAGALSGSVKADRAAADVAALNLEWSVIRAPVDGKTGPILIQPGNIVPANGTNPIVTIEQIHPVKVSFFLPQSDLPQIQQRMSQGLLTAQVQAHGSNGGRETAKVDFIGNAVSATTGTIELRATFPNDDDKLVPGQVVDVGVALNNFSSALVVPSQALNTGPDGRYVYAVADGKAKLVPVEVLNDDGTSAAIKGNLKPGDTVITDGQLRVIPGNPVSILKAGAKGTKPAAAQ